MKALSLWQPWASLIAIGVKPEETRSWPPPSGLVGQRIAIQAAKKPIEQATAGMPESAMHLIIKSLVRTGLDPMRLPLGKVVCTAVVGTPLQVLRLVLRSGGTSYVITRCGQHREINAFGDFSPGRWLWPMLNVEQVEPFDAIGRQGIFDLDGPAAARTPTLFGGAV